VSLPFCWLRPRTRKTRRKSYSSGDSQVRTIQSYAGTAPLPKPDRVQICDFFVPPDVVEIDESAAARLERRRALRKGADDTSPEAVGLRVQGGFSDGLLKALQKASVPVERIPESFAATAKNTLIVRGEFTRVDQGNQTKRVMIGFGRGASDVQAHVTLTLTTDTQPILLSEFEVRSESGKKPGAAATMGVGSLAVGAAAGSVTDRKATVEGDASRMAKAVTKQIVALMAAQKWISPPQPVPE